VSGIIPLKKKKEVVHPSCSRYRIQRRKKLFSIDLVNSGKDGLYTNILCQRTVILPKAEICTFPWYCLYRDIPFFPLSKEEKKENIGRNIEGLERLNKFLITNPKQTDQFFYLYRKINIRFGKEDFRKKKKSREILGIRNCVRWLSQEPCRTGGKLFLNRLVTFDQKDWCLQARQRLKVLKKNMKVFEKQGSLGKSERLRYRRFIRTRNQILIRLRILTEIQRAFLHPCWLILQSLPILPPDLRPVLSLGEGKIMVSDVNTLYQRVIERNIRIAQRRRLSRFHGNNIHIDLRYHERLLQEALECLFENSIKGKSREKDSKQRVYKSLAEVLKGKRGRFRNNLLGKRVDYSGRSVIISGSELILYQCGLPREIILTLFQPFLIRSLLGKFQGKQKILTRFQARQFLDQQTSERWNRRKQVLRGFPVLLNRAPTLHRFGLQAFQPKLIRGRAIKLHPLVCAGFNADFDGDQMAVHVPLSPNARAEACRLMTPGSHFFSPVTGEPIFLPSQDIVLGTYFLTTQRNIFSLSSSFSQLPGFFRGIESFPNTIKCLPPLPLLCSQQERIFQTFEKGHLNLHNSIWLYLQRPKLFDCEHDFFLYEIRLNQEGKEQRYSLWHWETKEPSIELFRTTVGRIVFSSLLYYLNR
jgi:DNA-directed RNA polymerase beta' subunit